MATITLDKTIIKAGETAVVTFTVEKTHFMGTLNGHVRDAIVTGGTISGGYDFRYIDALSTATTQVYPNNFTQPPPRSIKASSRLPRTWTEPSAPSATTLPAPPTTPPAPPSSSTPGRPPSRAPRRSATPT